MTGLLQGPRGREIAKVEVERELPDEAQVVLRRLFDDVAEVHRLPVRVEEFVRRIRDAHLQHQRQDLLRGRIRHEVLGVGVAQELRGGERVPDALLAISLEGAGRVEHEPPQRLDGSPAGERVVAEIEQPSDLELRSGARPEGPSLRGRDPREQAVRAQVVERRQLARGQVLEVALEEADVWSAPSAARLRAALTWSGLMSTPTKRARGYAAASVARVSPRPEPSSRIVEIVPGGGRAARERSGRAKHHRIELGAELPHVGDLGQVSRMASLRRHRSQDAIGRLGATRCECVNPRSIRCQRPRERAAAWTVPTEG